MEKANQKDVVLRHTKEDKKRYRRNRKRRQNGQLVDHLKTPAYSADQTVKKTKKQLRKLPFLSRGRAMVEHAVNNPSLSHASASCRSLIPTKRIRCNHTKDPDPSICFPEINRELLNFEPCDLGKKDIQLGEGTFGNTFLATYRGNIPVAVKKYKYNDKYQVWREAEVIATVQKNQHFPNLPFLFGVCTREKPYILVTQFYGNGVESWTLGRAVKELLLPLNEFCPLFQEACHAISYLHSKGWLHNDIKHNNLLLHFSGSRWIPVLIDFGKSRSLDHPKKYNLTDKQKEHYREKHPWIAPELIAGTSTQSIATDMFSFGVMVQWCLNHMTKKCDVLQGVSFSCLDSNAGIRPSASECKKRLESHTHKA